MIQLGPKTLFGRGGGRDCHFHPERPDRCLKITRADRTPKHLKRELPWYKRLRPDSTYDQNLRDLVVFRRAWNKLDGARDRGIPETEGLVDTNLGVALCVELLRDADGRVSLSLKEFIIENGFTEEAKESVEKLRQTFLEHRVMVRDPFPQNTVAQRCADGRLRIVFIDGIGDTTLIPVGQLFPARARERIDRKFDRMLRACRVCEGGRKIAGENGLSVQR